MSDADRPQTGLDVLAFAAELAVLALLAVSGWRLFPVFPPGLVLAVSLPLVFIVIWARWMAPRSATRLGNPARFLAQAALFIAATAVGIAAGLAPWSIAVGILAVSVFAAALAREARIR